MSHNLLWKHCYKSIPEKLYGANNLNTRNPNMKIHKAIESDNKAVAAFRIYAECWDSPTDKHSAIDDAARRLRSLIVGSNDAEGCIYSSIDALRYFFREEPLAMDFGLDIFRKAAAELPQSVEHGYGKGPAGAENILKWYLVEFSTFFQGNVPPQNLGKEDNEKPGASDGSNVMFNQSDINNARSAVLQKLEDWQKERLDIIVMLAVLGRCHSKSFARLTRGEQVGDHALVSINNALDRQKPGTPLWAKADFIGCCVLLRACAKSLIEVLPPAMRDSTLEKWKDGLVSFLHSDGGGSNVDDDFAVKIHAVVSSQSDQIEELADGSRSEHWII
jgi:hypothetical protein